jgi:hydroxymethylglutaryl-CoA lyase
MVALAQGVETLDASVGGLGGSPFSKTAIGNLATEDLLWLCRAAGVETGVDVDRIVATAAWLHQELGHRSAPGMRA